MEGCDWVPTTLGHCVEFDSKMIFCQPPGIKNYLSDKLSSFIICVSYFIVLTSHFAELSILGL